MKNRNKQRFDYEKEIHNKYDSYSYYGLHMRDHRLHIDTKRLKLFVDRDLFPEIFDAPRNTHYFIPAKKYIDDYKINQLYSTLNWLEYEWEHTYAGYYHTLKHPKQVYEDKRMNDILMTTDSDAVSDFNEDALIAAVKAAPLYQARVLDLFYVYLEKIQQEFFNKMTYIADEMGYSEDDFSFGSFLNYFNGYIQGKNHENDKRKTFYIQNCKHFKYFDFLNRVINFIKHKTIRSYDSIKFEGGPRDLRCPYRDEFRKYVANVRYKNGMDASKYLDLPDNFIKDTINNLKEFSKEICNLAFDEDYEEARWNSDEYIFKKINQFITIDDNF